MNRNYISRRIRRHGTTYLLKQGATVQPFSAYMKDGSSLWVTALELPTGSLIAPLARPEREYIVSSQLDRKLYEEYQLLKVNCCGSLARFSDSTRDSFGRTTTDTPVTIYLELPLHLYPTADSSDKTTADRSATATTYRFSVPTLYILKPKDRLHIGDSTLIVSTVILTPDSLTTFEAISS